MSFDYKKEYKEYYMPKNRPEIVTVPPMNFIAVRGSGDPNLEYGDYKRAIGLLYGIAFTIKMSKKGDHRIDGYFDYVVPPLEGFWWQSGVQGVDYSHKEQFQWISVIRLPDSDQASDKKSIKTYMKIDDSIVIEYLNGNDLYLRDSKKVHNPSKMVL